MTSITTYEFGDVVLVPFPYTDLSGGKKRPTVVISSPAYHRDHINAILIAIGSTPVIPPRAGMMPIADWRAAGLVLPSFIKPSVFTIARTLIHRKLGRLSQADEVALRAALTSIIG